MRKKEPVSADIYPYRCTFYQSAALAGQKTISMYALSGENREDGYAVYKIREIAFGGGTKLVGRGRFSAVYDRAASCQQCAAEEIDEDEDEDEDGDDMKLTSLTEYHGFYDLCGKNTCRTISVSGREEILAVARSHEVSPEETQTCTESTLHYDEHSVEEQLF